MIAEQIAAQIPMNTNQRNRETAKEVSSISMRLPAVVLIFATLTITATAQTVASSGATGTVGNVPYISAATGTSTTLGSSPISVSGGNVGIGTASQYVDLNVNGVFRAIYPGIVGPDFEWNNPSKTANGTANHWDVYNMTGGYGNSLQFWDYDTIGCVTGGMCASRLTLMDSGNVGVGTTSPQYTLDVAGSVHASGPVYYPDGTQQTTAWTGVLCGGDYAESVDVTGNRKKYEPGDVLVIDPRAPGKFLKSAEPYSTSVLGIYSTKPGMVGRRQTAPKGEDEVPMAMIGIVPTKVTAENGAINPGDLLVTSSTPGYAMKGTDRNRMLGAVIGKALGSLDSGVGVIEVGITLQ